MSTRKILGIMTLVLVTVVLTSLPCSAVAPGTGKKCYNCDNISGTWKCKEGGFIGGTECTADQDSCSVSGACGTSGSGASYSLSFDTVILMDVAMVHPRAAATLYKLGANGACDADTVVSWYNDAITPDDVQVLIDEGTIGLEPVGPAVVYEATITPFGNDGDIVIRIVATQPSDLDPAFDELLVFLAPDGPDGPYVPYTWHLNG